jgi:hypothetical protein
MMTLTPAVNVYLEGQEEAAFKCKGAPPLPVTHTAHTGRDGPH